MNLLETPDILQAFVIAEAAKRYPYPDSLKNKTVCLAFFQPSTRTRMSFEIAAKNLGANVIHFDCAGSAMDKGESLMDSFKTMEALGVNTVVIRSEDERLPHNVAEHTYMNVINAGSGHKHHPTQAVGDFDIIEKLKAKKLAFVGDFKHNRVAHSLVPLLRTLGVEIMVVGPPQWTPTEWSLFSMEEMVEWQPDVIYSLRAHQRGGNMSFLVKYHNGYWTIREEHIQNGAVVMHAGPVMRNQDISDDVLSSPNCYVREQVQTGLRVRQAVLRMYS